MVPLMLLGTIALGVATPAAAADVKKVAILIPEEPTDYGWNQQAFEAAKAVAEKYNLQFLPASGLGYGDVRPTLRELAGISGVGESKLAKYGESILELLGA